MNREIKFRAWDEKTKQVCDVWFINWNDGEVGIHDDHRAMHDVRKFDEVELMQYIGLKDKNGKEIYEGDILRCKLEGSDFEHIVMIDFGWSKDGEYGLYFVWKQGKQEIVRKQDKIEERYEVIANKFENPELLK